MKSAHRFSPVIFCLLMIISTLLFALEEGDQAGKFANPDFSGRFVLSKDIIGKGWVILDFFATDCEACKKELPEIESLYEDFKEKGLVVIVFATDQGGASVVKPYFQEHPTELLILVDRYRKTTEKYGVEEIPSIFLINPEGVIAAREAGYSEEFIEGIREILLDM